jgi:hypothetical protein
LAQAIEGLPIDVIQGASDEAKELLRLRHVKKKLGAHHSPDLFHVQHEIDQATGLHLQLILQVRIRVEHVISGGK